MSTAYLGSTFDIHTGGVDLIFPHHEDEIAQSEAATGQPFVRTWLHCAHLQMGGAKMAKSAGNIARVGDLLDAGVSPRALRYALLSVHYRARLDYSDESLAAAGAAVARLDAAAAALEAYREERADDPELPAVLDDARTAFGAALDDDLNISAALAAVFDLVRELNRRIEARSLSTADAAAALASLRDLDGSWASCPTRPMRSTRRPSRCWRRARPPGRPATGRLGSVARRARGAGDRGRGHPRRPALATPRGERLVADRPRARRQATEAAVAAGPAHGSGGGPGPGARHDRGSGPPRPARSGARSGDPGVGRDPPIG